jgi:hypothetical protein
MEEIIRKGNDYENEIEQVKKKFKKEGAKYFAVLYNKKKFEYWCYGNVNEDFLRDKIKFFLFEIGKEGTILEFDQIETL